ncbi:MAG: multiheme c-type cytochrome [Thermoleophilia bacterium]
MKWRSRICILGTFLLVLAFMAGCGDNSSQTTATATSFTSITPAFKSTEFTDITSCGACHRDIMAQWQGSMHSNSFTDSFYQSVHGQASADTSGATDAFCTGCHTPIGTFSGEVPPLEGPQISSISRNGVQCDFCHTVTGNKGTGDFRFQFAPSKTKRGPFADAVSPAHLTAYSDLHTRSEFCGMCHDVNHPVNKIPLEATYTEWQNSPYAAEGIQCQDCHMTPGPGVTKPNPGIAVFGGRERPHIYTHYFVGGNATQLAWPQQQQMAQEELKAAADVTISKSGVIAPGAQAGIAVTVTNKGAGHYLPTGLTEVREMWLEVAVTDSTGKELFHSGSVSDTGNVDPDAVMYNTTFTDKDGQPTHKPWLAEKLLYDRRIPPRGVDTADYAFMVPADAPLPLRVTATLHYRTAPQSYVNEVMGDSAFQLPIIDMAVAQSDIS